MDVLLRQTDAHGRVTLPLEFALCMVTIEVDGETLTIRKGERVIEQKYSLKEMLEQVTPENLHGEISSGPPVGKEIL